MGIVSKAEFARQLHVSRARVSQMSGQGMPLTPGGRVNMKDAIAWMEAHVDMGHGRFSATIPDGQGSFSPAVALGSTAASTAPVPAAGRDGLLDPRRILLTARAKAALLAVRKAERQERQERRESGELVEAAEIIEAVQEIVINARNKLLSLSFRLAPRLAYETDTRRCQQIVEDGVLESLQQLSEYKPV